jgi:hypothetical protein
MRRAMLVVAWMLAALPAWAASPAPPDKSAPVESVTVTGAGSRAVVEQFVQGFAAPARVTGKLARWTEGVCPAVIGLKPQFTDFIAQRIRDVAGDVGAPVQPKNSRCTPNIEVVFTTALQALADNIRKHNAVFLGYADTRDQMDALAKVTQPIQAWYTTATRDVSGSPQIDSSKVSMSDTPVVVPCFYCSGGTMTLYGVSAASVTGSRLGDGRRSSLYHVIIAAEPAKLMDYEIGTLADYIALMALTQLSSVDVCQPLSSIANLLVKDCPNASRELTTADLAYLRGLYSMSADRTLVTQENEIVSRMQQGLGGD